MTHYLLLKFKDSRKSDSFFKLASDAFQKLEQELECVRDVRILKNCVKREGNADLLIQMEVDGEAGLKAYLEHPVHRRLAEEMEPFLSRRVSFDNEAEVREFQNHQLGRREV